MSEGAVRHGFGGVGILMSSRYRVLPWMLVVAVSAAAEDDRGLAHINAALQAWLRAIEADVPYLLVDRGAAEFEQKACIQGLKRRKNYWK